MLTMRVDYQLNSDADDARLLTNEMSASITTLNCQLVSRRPGLISTLSRFTQRISMIFMATLFHLTNQDQFDATDKSPTVEDEQQWTDVKC